MSFIFGLIIIGLIIGALNLLVEAFTPAPAEPPEFVGPPEPTEYERMTFEQQCEHSAQAAMDAAIAYDRSR